MRTRRKLQTPSLGVHLGDAETSVIRRPLGLFLLLVVSLGWGADRALAQSGRDPTQGLVATARGIFTASPSSTEGALTLLLPIGARGVGLGGAMTSVPGAESAFWNPAGLAALEDGGFFVFRGDHLAGDATAFSLVLAPRRFGTLGFSYHLLDLGGQDLTDEENNRIGSFSVRDHLAVVSYALRFLPGLDTGINFKVFQSRYTCRGQCTDAGVTGTAYALDAGLQARPLPDVPLRLGVLLAHVGPKLQLINVEQADPLPTRVRAAVSFETLGFLTEAADVELWVTAELEDRLRELGNPVLFLGAEFTAGGTDLVFLRAGYGQQGLGESAGASVGFGLRYQQFDLGIAKRLSGSSSSGGSAPVHFSFGVLFGGARD